MHVDVVWLGKIWVPVVLSSTLFLTVFLLLLRKHWRSDWDRRRIRTAFQEIDALDQREAAEQEYEAPLGFLGQGLPAWGAALAFERLADQDSPSRRRMLQVLSQSEFLPLRERLVDLARDSTDPLAAEIWELLTGRHRSLWSKALTESDGKAGFADPPAPRNGPWCGYYVQLGAEHRMDLMLTFDGERLTGEGTDVVGPFRIDGEILDGAMVATKRYRTHPVEYRGTVEGDMIVGGWSLFAGAGRFRLWPRRGAVAPPTVPKG